MDQKIGVSLFIPVYNEEKIIMENVFKVKEELEKITPNYEIVIVDDSSKDNTPKICKKLSNSKIKYSRFENGPSRRENLAVAMKEANNEIIAFIDADLATDLKYLRMLIEGVKNHDICIGSRYLGISAKRSAFRKSLSIIYNFLIRFLLDSKIKDHQCGFKAFKKERLIELINDAGYDKKFVRGWFWDAEILVRAQKKGYKIKEFPVEWKAGKDSSFLFKRELKVIKYILKLKRNL